MILPGSVTKKPPDFLRQEEPEHFFAAPYVHSLSKELELESRVLHTPGSLRTMIRWQAVLAEHGKVK